MNFDEILDDLKHGNISAQDAFHKIKQIQDEKLNPNQQLQQKQSLFITKNILAEVLLSDLENISDNCTLIELGVDSITLHQLTIKLEESYSLKIPIQRFVSNIITVKDLSNEIESHIAKGGSLDKSPAASSFQKHEILKQQIEPKPMAPKEWQLNSVQKAYLAEFFNSFINKTKKSYQSALDNRAYFADLRLQHFYTQEFKPIWHQIIYKSAEGAYIKDIDDNSYLDIAGDYGANLFGHRNKEILGSVIEQMINVGGVLSLQSPLLQETAKMFCQITEHDRVAFCQSGSEAVMVAIRIARAYTSKQKIVIFKGSYHGLTDGVLVHGNDSSIYARPRYLGVNPSAVQDVIYLPYDNLSSLQCIEDNAMDIAAVVVEPVQSRYPEVQPKEFLLRLRELCSDRSMLLIFDEMITGFRVHKRGAQGIFNIKPDLATYGKIICGGLTGGLLAGKAEFMSVVDGGQWLFNDESTPSNKVTFMGATHTHNPYKIAAINAVLRKIEKLGDSFYENLNQRTALLADKLNYLMYIKGVAIKVVSFGSLFRFKFMSEESGSINFTQPYEKTLFGKLLQFHGVHYLHQGNCFITEAHTDEDLKLFHVAVEKTIDTLIKHGFISSNSESISSIKEFTDIGAYERIPLSYEQKALWFNSKLENDYSIDTIPICLTLKSIAIDLLEKAVIETVKYHPMLGCVMANEITIEPYQYFVGNYATLLKLEPIIKFKQSRNELIKQIIDFAREPINLSEWPNFKIRIYEHEESFFVVFVFHHLFIDGQSVNIFLNDLLKNYVSLIEGDYKGLSSPGIEYATYIRDQDRIIKTEFVTGALDYWSKVLDKITSPPNLPKDYNSNSIILSDYYHLLLPATLSKEIYDFCQKNNCSLFNFFTAMFALFIWSITGDKNFLIAIPTNPKDRFTVYKDVIGNFVNQLPLVIAINPNDTLAKLLNQTKSDIYACLNYQALPFILLVEKLNLSGKMNKLLRLAINIDIPFAFPNDIQKFVTSVDLKHLPVFNHTSNTDLGCIINEYANEIELAFSYNKHLFKHETIQEFLNSFVNIIQQAIRNDSDTFKTSQLINNASSKTKSIISDFENIVKTFPNSNALEFKAHLYTYSELNDLADKFFCILLKNLKEGFNTLERQPVIALCFERSSDYVVALLACLKIRAIFLPIDPNWPDERKRIILDSSACALLVYDISSQERLSNIKFNKLMFDVAKFSMPDSGNMEIFNYQAKDYIYIIYTSGSTGSPKGVVISNEGLLNTIDYANKTLPITKNDKILQFASICFDASIWEIFSALLAGATLYIPSSAEEILPGEELHKVLLQNSITTALLPPSVLLVTPNKGLNKLTKLISGGEALTPKIFDKWHINNRNIFNAYGPTEASIFCTLSDPIQNFKSITLGRAIDHMHMIILDENLESSDTGELYISGVGLSQCYWNNQELTSKHFITLNDQRYFKSGDRVRFESGNLHFLGRVDQTLKIRGHRIDLNEIDWHINRIPEVRQAIVVAVEADYSALEIIAFIHGDEGIEEDGLIKIIKNNLRQVIPSYMLPSHYRFIKRFPLTISGKIDIKQLKTNYCKIKSKSHNSVDENNAEDKLRNIWAKTFQSDGLKIKNNFDFFDMGGNSLMAIYLVDQIKKAFQKSKINVTDVFEKSTFGEILELLEINDDESERKQFADNRDHLQNS